MPQPKSLFGVDQERLHRANTGRESLGRTIPVELMIVDVITNYRPISSLKESSRSIIEKYDLDGLIVESGLHFLVGTIDQQSFTIIASPKTEDELRAIYGSEDNIIGKKIIVDTLNEDLSTINTYSIKFKSSEYYYLEDNDRYMPVTIGNI